MKTKYVKDIMIPVEEYAVTTVSATVLDAIIALEKSQKNLPYAKHRHRAVLVRDNRGDFIGKVDHLAFIRALEPKYNLMGDTQTLARAGLSHEFIASMIEQYHLFEDSLSDLSNRARTINITDIMSPITDRIQETASLRDAVHQLVMLRVLSLPVVRGNKIVGMLRLGDVFDEIAHEIKRTDQV